MIQVTDIHKSFGTVEVLKGVSLQIKEKEIVSVVGSSGAGKTTLLQIMGSLLEADQGKVEINGTDISSLRKNKMAAFRNQHIGFVFQFHQLLPEFTALENICIPAFIAKKGKAEAEKRAKDLLDFLNLSHRATHKPKELSGGEQQRVAVARALVNSPEVIFADEPSGNLDTENKQDLHELFFKLRDQFGHTFVIVTHDNELAKMSDRAVVMKDGNILNGA
jgi:lipoprotein-releasing system ATP-binding protein